MRTVLSGGLLAAMLMTASYGHAQTWEHPLPFNQNFYTSSMNSCSFPAQNLYMDYGAFPIYAPAVIYHVWQLSFGRPPPPLRPWWVGVSPQGWDASVWICRQRIGDYVNDCVDLSDEYGPGSYEHVDVPANFGGYYVIVTASVQENPGFPCGEFTLTAFH